MPQLAATGKTVDICCRSGYRPVMSTSVPAAVRAYMSALAKRKRVVTPAMLEQRRKALVTANERRLAKKAAARES
jgi:hypothetical protein